MWDMLFDASTFLLRKQFDALDVFFITVGFFVTGANIALEMPNAFAFTCVIAIASVYVLAAYIVLHMRRYAYQRMVGTDPLNDSGSADDEFGR